ncbi:MAG TPA: hypothetical protein VLG25_01215 [Patescibacteria group bacterium]|nr:hypothetical protein [Patescibacteria group bacterium]
MAVTEKVLDYSDYDTEPLPSDPRSIRKAREEWWGSLTEAQRLAAAITHSKLRENAERGTRAYRVSEEDIALADMLHDYNVALANADSEALAQRVGYEALSQVVEA